MSNYKDNRDYWIKQSEMLQAAITRMANNSLEVKKAGLTVWAAILGFGVTTGNRYLFLLAFVSFVLFGVLDIYYLFLERKFRDNFNRLSRILSGFVTQEDDEWILKLKGNFLKLDGTIRFQDEIPNILKSWANLPYVITLLLTILLLIVPLPPLPQK